MQADKNWNQHRSPFLPSSKQQERHKQRQEGWVIKHIKKKKKNREGKQTRMKDVLAGFHWSSVRWSEYKDNRIRGQKKRLEDKEEEKHVRKKINQMCTDIMNLEKNKLLT